MSPSVWLHSKAPHHLVRSLPRAAPAAAPPATATAATAVPPFQKCCAYVTLLTKDAYLPGVQALYRSLRLVKSRHPLIVLYTKGVSQDALEALAREGIHLQFTDQFEVEGVDHSKYKRPLYLECWNKLRMWEMTEYDRLAYLDADVILLRNIDHLFSLPPGFYAVGDCYGGRDSGAAEERDACCHFKPEATPPYFNAGFYVMNPSLSELEGMRVALRERRVAVHFFAEQDFLNGYFEGRWRHLPWSYNSQKRIKFHHPNLWDMSNIYAIHYVDEKPWSQRYSEENLRYKEECDYWWDVFEGRLVPRQQPMRQMSTGLDSTPAEQLAELVALAPGGAASLAGQQGVGMERTSSVPTALPQVW